MTKKSLAAHPHVLNQTALFAVPFNPPPVSTARIRARLTA